jgi:hypothetical protein
MKFDPVAIGSAAVIALIGMQPMRAFCWATLVTLSLLQIAPAAAQTVDIVGAGVGVSCGTWLEHRATGQPDIANWALGYLSGVAVWGFDRTMGHKAPLRGMDADGVLYWLDNYCHVNPTNKFTDALAAFVEQHPR